MQSKTVVEVQGLRKSYGDLQVLNNINFSINQGEIFSILGPNGAGKTTCLEILEGFREADSGQVSIFGYDPKSQERSFKEKIGIVVQTSGMEDELTATEILLLYGSNYKSPKHPAELLEMVNLKEKANVRIDKLSGGQRRRLDFALGLVGDPDLIFLDEPTTGFAPESRREAWKVLLNLRSLGKTILLTSHYMEEVERLSDRLAILLGGKIVLEGKLQDLRKDLTSVKFILPEGWGKANLESLLDQGKVEAIEMNGEEVTMMTKVPTELLHQLTLKAHKESLELRNLSVQLIELEDVYLDVIKKENDPNQWA